MAARHSEDSQESSSSAVSGGAVPVYVRNRIELDSHYDPSSGRSYIDQIYKSRSLLGNGGFGFVFKFTNRFSEKKYAVKEFRGNKSTRSKMAEIEGNEMVGNHQHVLKYYMAWQEDYKIYMLLELSQFSLIDFCLQFQFEETFLWDCLHDISQALKHMHSRNLVHRDIKGGNIMVHGNHFKLSDFGTVLDLSRYPEHDQGIHRPPRDIQDLALVLTTLFRMFSRQATNKRISIGLNELVRMMRHEDPRRRITAPQILMMDDMKKVAERLAVSRPVYRDEGIEDIEGLLPLLREEITPPELPVGVPPLTNRQDENMPSTSAQR